MMILKRFSVKNQNTNCYVAACPNTRQAMILDPGEWTQEIADFIASNKLIVTCIFLTHAHGDHAQGASEAQKLYNCKVLAGKGENYAGENIEEIEEDDLIELGDIQGFVISTPGHTPGGVSLFMGDAVFTGDALFSGSVGGTDDHDKFLEQARAIWGKVLTVGDQVSLNPGHGPRSTVGVERIFNPFFDDFRT